MVRLESPTYGDPAGRLTQLRHDGSAYSLTFGFTGRETDQETDLYYYRARYYDPRLGRFVGEDPKGFAAGDVNLRRYTGNDPVGKVDPSGLEYIAVRGGTVYWVVEENGYL